MWLVSRKSKLLLPAWYDANSLDPVNIIGSKRYVLIYQNISSGLQLLIASPYLTI